MDQIAGLARSYTRLPLNQSPIRVSVGGINSPSSNPGVLR